MSTLLTSTVSELRAAVAKLRAEGKRIGLVPTMGALHAGHLSLIEVAKRHADAVVVSIFVNPAQFGPNEDFSKYPRTLEEDIQKVNKAGTALCYAPPVEDIYPPGFATEVRVTGLSDQLCGQFRPRFFPGVATVVTKLLLRVMPDITVFGEKDYQQFMIVRRLAADLDIPVTVIPGPTVREADGLAMSSRNAYLSAQERKTAAALYATLQRAAEYLKREPSHVKHGLIQAEESLKNAGFTAVDYVALHDALTLEPLETYRPPARLLAAAWLGKTRLIDNIEVL